MTIQAEERENDPGSSWKFWFLFELVDCGRISEISGRIGRSLRSVGEEGRNMRLCCLVLILFAYGTDSTCAQVPQKYALLVAVTTYKHAYLNQPPKIQFPEADARAIGQVLQGCGYEVELLLGENAGKDNIDRALAALAEKGNHQGVVLLGFFGHGVEYEEQSADGKSTSRSYFCPFDCGLRKRLDSRGQETFVAPNQPQVEPDPKTLISIASIFAALNLSPAGNRVLLADCCRNDRNAARTVGRGFGAGVAAGDLSENANTAALFACSKGEQALEDPESGHGAFTKCVLDWLRNPPPNATGGNLGEHLVSAVPALVQTLTNGSGNQQPKFLAAGRVDLQLRTAFEGAVAGEVKRFQDADYRWCPSGTFTRGSPASESGRNEDENPVEVVLSTGFWIQETEVTQRQFQLMMKTSPWQGKKGVTQGEDYPANYVNWADAAEYCRRLTKQQQEAGTLPDGWTCSLPSESQWEYACRCGSSRRFAHGDDEEGLQEFAWWGGLSGRGSARSSKAPRLAGIGRPNSWGIRNLHGNVAEWCRDWYDTRNRGGRDPVGPPSGIVRITRGGSWEDDAESCRCAARNGNSEEYRGSSTGFRVVVTVK